MMSQAEYNLYIQGHKLMAELGMVRKENERLRKQLKLRGKRGSNGKI